MSEQKEPWEEIQEEALASVRVPDRPAKYYNTYKRSVEVLAQRLAEAEAREAKLRLALARLSNEVGGSVLHPSWKYEIRAALGNTNFRCLSERWAEAKELLKPADGEEVQRG